MMRVPMRFSRTQFISCNAGIEAYRYRKPYAGTLSITYPRKPHHNPLNVLVLADPSSQFVYSALELGPLWHKLSHDSSTSQDRAARESSSINDYIQREKPISFNHISSWTYRYREPSHSRSQRHLNAAKYRLEYARNSSLA